MDDKIFDQVHDVDLKKTMATSYIDYAMSVIQWVNTILMGIVLSMVLW